MNVARMMVVIVALGLAACGRSPDPSTSEATKPAPAAGAGEHEDEAGEGEVRVEAGMLRDLRVTTAQVESRRGDEQLTLLGELAVDEGAYAEVGVPVAARVVRLLAGLGEAVKAGQPLLELQSVEVGQARSGYLAAAARKTLADSALARKRGLAAERIAPAREVQEAEAEAAAAQAQVRAATAALNALGVPVPDGPDGEGLRASTFFVRAPVAGVVIERRAMRGQMLAPDATAFRVADLSRLWLTVHAFERDALRIRPGATARVTFSALPAQEFPGRVAVVGQQVSSESRTIDVRIEVRNRGQLRPGMSASATLPIGVSDAPILAVPVASVQRVGERWCVFVPKGTGIFEIRAIGRGRDLRGEVEVLSGLTAGDTIVVDGAFLLKSQAEKRDAGHDDH